jgi:hypothetical protein
MPSDVLAASGETHNLEKERERDRELIRMIFQG